MGGANKLRVTAVDSVVPVLGSGVDITCKRKDELPSICISIFKKNINFEMNLKDVNIELNLILL